MSIRAHKIARIRRLVSLSLCGLRCRLCGALVRSPRRANSRCERRHARCAHTCSLDTRFGADEA